MNHFITELQEYKYDGPAKGQHDHAADALRYSMIVGTKRSQPLYIRVLKVVGIIVVIALIVIYWLFASDILNLSEL